MRPYERRSGLAAAWVPVGLLMLATAAGAADKPNILVIWGDDIGWYNVSAYNMGVMGYRTPNIDRITLRGDPFERADHEGLGYDRWRIDHIFLLVPAQAYVARWLQSFREFPPRQEPASFSLDRVMETLITAGPRAQ